MSNWGPVFVGVVLFILLIPGLLIQMPGRNRFVEFGNFQTSGVSILVHSIIYFALICIFLLAIGFHMYTSILFFEVLTRHGDSLPDETLTIHQDFVNEKR